MPKRRSELSPEELKKVREKEKLYKRQKRAQLNDEKKNKTERKK